MIERVFLFVFGCVFAMLYVIYGIRFMVWLNNKRKGR